MDRKEAAQNVSISSASIAVYPPESKRTRQEAYIGKGEIQKGPQGEQQNKALAYRETRYKSRIVQGLFVYYIKFIQHCTRH